MSVNQSFSFNNSRAEKMGNHFSSIDFEINPDLTSEIVKSSTTKCKVGSFSISNKKFDLNLNEINRIIETLESAKEIYIKKYKLGIYR